MRIKKAHFADVYVETCPDCGLDLTCTRTIKAPDGMVRQELSCPCHGVKGWRYKKHHCYS